MVDLTEIPALFRLFSFKLLVVLDVFSRAPLVWKLFLWEPSAASVRRLFQRAIVRYGKPRHLVSDRGTQFTARALRRWLQREAIQQRLGRVGQSGSIAIIERFWKTTKQLLGLPFYKPLLRRELARHIEASFFYYAHLRPHHGLGGATPDEMVKRSRPAHPQAVSPPRGRPGERAAPAPFRIAYFESHKRLPYLIHAAAA